MKKFVLTTALTGLFSLSFPANRDLILAQSSQTTQTQSTIIAVAKVGLGRIRPGISEQQVRSIIIVFSSATSITTRDRAWRKFMGDRITLPTQQKYYPRKEKGQVRKLIST
jgi:hypothetical protein